MSDTDAAATLANHIRDVLTNPQHQDLDTIIRTIVTRAHTGGLLRNPGPSHTEWGVLLHNGNSDGAFWGAHREYAEEWAEDGDRLITRTRTTHPDTVTDWTYVADWPSDWTTEPT